MNFIFCKDGFWNNTSFNNKQYPIFTECFQFTILLIPSSLLLIMIIFWLLSQRFTVQIKMNVLAYDYWYILKMVYHVLLVLLILIEFIMKSISLVKYGEPFDGMFVFSYAALTICLVKIIILTQYRRLTKHPICPILFTFAFSALIAYLVRFYSNVVDVASKMTTFTSIGILFVSCMTMFLFLINFITECCPQFLVTRLFFNKQTPCPEESASILSKLTFFWLDTYIYKWYKNDITDETAFELKKEDETTRNTDLVENLFLKSLKEKRSKFRNNRHSVITSKSNLISKNDQNEDNLIAFLNPGCLLLKSLLKVFLFSFLTPWIYDVIFEILQVGMAILLKILLQFASNKNSPPWQGYCIGIMFFISGFIMSIFSSASLFLTSNLSIRIRSALMAMIYRKTLRLSNEVYAKYNSGELLNLISVDAERIMECICYSWFIVTCPLQIFFTLYFLYTELGISILACVSVIFFFLLVNFIVMNFLQKFSKFELNWKDKRVSIISDILKGIKVLKMYAWEESFISKVSNIRKKEVGYICNISICTAIINVFYDILPFLMTLSTFLVYVHFNVKDNITSDKIFVSFTLFNFLRAPLTFLPLGLTFTVNAFISIKRIALFLVEEEISLDNIYRKDKSYSKKGSNDIIIEVQNGSFSWKSHGSVTLKNINMNVKRGQLVAIVGKVGAGKSSLLSAFLGEMIKMNGIVKIKGQIAYVPQEAWIQNKSLKDNILFTQSYDERFYEKVVKACCLIPDFEHLPAGENTEIGERGINLSGGQKQRVNLARAIYQNKDVYFLDDPLSAMDAHVGQYLFDEVISNEGLLSDKTRVLVTHGLKWLPKVDKIFVLNSFGEISDSGSYQELLNESKEFKLLIEEYLTKESDNKEAMASEFEPDTLTDSNLRPIINEIFTSVELAKSSHSEKRKDLDQIMIKKKTAGDKKSVLIEDEEVLTGTVNWRTYLFYFKSRGSVILIFALMAYILFVGLHIYGGLWLKEFASDVKLNNARRMIITNSSKLNTFVFIIRQQTDYYMTFYGIIGIAQLIAVILYSIGLVKGNVTVSKTLHKLLLFVILRSPISFFDTTPSGRILNRFSKDLDLVDHIVPMNSNEILISFFSLISSIIIIIIVTPWFILFIIPVLIIFYFLQLFYMPSSRQSRRLDSIALSIVFNKFVETIQGTTVIRAFSEESKFKTINEKLIDQSSKFKFIQFASLNWFGLRLDVLGNLLVFGAVIFSIINRENLSPSFIGLSISFALQITFSLNWFLRQYSEFETNFVAIERIREYTLLQSEAPWKIARECNDEWLSDGNISFQNINLRYREGLPFVLNDIELSIKGGEKIGVVGRTGAGKSSLALALCRLIEPTDGTIIIDNVDITSLGLHDLRKRLTTLPQDPVIFCGTLRENLDPFERHTESELDESLERSHLKQWVSSLQEGLDYDCGEGGANLSTGQKQLLCLARAILRKSKVLILDEATASVDVETDRLVMETVREQFSASTVIIIAHRINTIMDTDKVVVLDQGKIVEYGSPQELLQIPGGFFKSLSAQNNNDL